MFLSKYLLGYVRNDCYMMYADEEGRADHCGILVKGLENVSPLAEDYDDVSSSS